MKPLFLLPVLPALLFGGAARAQSQTDSISTRNLEEIVITGQYEPQSVQKSVYRVRTIPMEKIQARGAVKLQDVLNTELNIRFSQDLALGGSNISMQGLEGQNVKILIDGVPMIGRQGTSNEININQINVNTIERIEIIEGPMSVVYGADALAGVINIITKKSASGRVGIFAKVHEESVGKEYGLYEGIHNESVGLGYARKHFHVRGDFSRNFFGGWKGDSTGREKMWHPKAQWLANTLLGFTNDRSRVYYRLDYLNEDIYNAGNFGADGNPPDLALDQNYITDRWMHQMQGDYSLSTRLNLTGALAYTDYSRRTRSTTVNETTGDVRLALGEGRQDLTTFDGLTFRGTFRYKVNDRLTFQPGVDLNTESGEGGRIKQGLQSIGDYAFFISGEWSVIPRIQLRPGIRFIHNTVYTAPPAVPSVNAKVTITDRQDLRLSYGRGFRAPSLRELYFDFFDASHSIEGNPGLRAELSHSFNGSWNWQVVRSESLRFTSVLGGFYNAVRDRINYGQKPGSSVTTYINIDHYRTKGITLNNVIKGKSWDLGAGLAWTGRFNQLSDAMDVVREFSWSPEITATASYNVPRFGLNLSAYYKYTGRTPYYEIFTDNGSQTAGLARVSPYHWADLSVQKDLLKHFTVTGGLRNLFDVTTINSTSVLAAGTHSGGAVRPIGSGRAYYLGISYSLN